MFIGRNSSMYLNLEHMQRQIEYIKYSSEEYPLSANYILDWLDDNYDLYIRSLKEITPTSCRQNTLPCFCDNRKETCLFVEIYEFFEELKPYGKFNEVCYSELEKYKKLFDADEIKDWLRSNLDFGLNKLEKFGDEYSKIKARHFMNGRRSCSENFDGIDVYISLEDFEQIYAFKALFDDLFFNKEMFPEALKRYKEKIQETLDEFFSSNQEEEPTSEEYLKSIEGIMNKIKY